MKIFLKKYFFFTALFCLLFFASRVKAEINLRAIYPAATPYENSTYKEFTATLYGDGFVKGSVVKVASNQYSNTDFTALTTTYVDAHTLTVTIGPKVQRFFLFIMRILILR